MLALLLAAPSAHAQQQQGTVILESSEQVFCVMAALNAGGYDTGLGHATEDPTREEAREYLAQAQAPVAKRLENFYAQHRVEGDPGADLGQYVSLALLLGPPPDFKLLVPQTDLPPDARAVSGLVPLLKTFYVQAKLHELWSRLQVRYQAAEVRYSAAARQAMFMTD
ncbi:MAG: hypothetical protein WBO19_19470, partial [Terriglobia bacterium]